MSAACLVTAASLEAAFWMLPLANAWLDAMAHLMTPVEDGSAARRGADAQILSDDVAGVRHS